MERPTDYEICVLRIHRSKHGEKSPPEGHGAPCYGRGLITSSQKLRLRISRKGKYEGGCDGCGCKGWVVAGPAHDHVYEEESRPVSGSVPIHIRSSTRPPPATTKYQPCTSSAPGPFSLSMQSPRNLPTNTPRTSHHRQPALRNAPWKGVVSN
jgi:hypothetical protein